jgi:hypothetical protein
MVLGVPEGTPIVTHVTLGKVNIVASTEDFQSYNLKLLFDYVQW